MKIKSKKNILAKIIAIYYFLNIFIKNQIKSNKTFINMLFLKKNYIKNQINFINKKNKNKYQKSLYNKKKYFYIYIIKLLIGI